MKKYLVITLAHLLFFINCKADTIPYSVQHYTDENGLPQNSVKFIAPDSNGFIWLATENGLVKFSGFGFTSFDRQNIPINSSRIRAIMQGTDPAYLFASTESNEIIVVKDSKVSEILPAGQLNEAMTKNMAIPLADWYRYIGISDPYKYAVHIDTFFISAGLRGAYRITKKELRFNDRHGNGFSIPFETTLPWQFFLFHDQLYYIDEKGALLTFVNGSVASAALSGNIHSNPGYRRHPGHIRIFHSPVPDDVLIYTGGSLYRLSKSSGNGLEANRVLDNFDFDRNSIVCAHYDSIHKRIFLGSLTKGMFVFTRKQFVAVNSSDSADVEVQYAQAPYDKERVLGSHGRVLGLSGEPLILPLLKDREDNFSFFFDEKQNLWTKQGVGLYVFNKAGTQLLEQWTLPSEITQIYRNKENIVWIGTLSTGLYRLDPSLAQRVPQSFLPGLHHVTYMQQANDSILWAATNDGLYRVDLLSKKTDTVPGLRNKFIRSLYIRGDDELWAATYGDGFYLYSGNRLVQFPFDRNKYLATTHCIVEDDQGYFWLTTNKGLFQVPRSDLLAYAQGNRKDVWYLFYDKLSGFNTNEFNGGCLPCALKMDNGTISFPSMNGLVWINPRTVEMELPDKEIFISDVALDNQPLPIGDTLRLPARFQLLQLTAGTPYFGNAYNIRLEYAIANGADTPTTWRSVGDDKIIAVPGLASGTYHFFIRKRQGFGADNYTYKMLVIGVDSVFYETWPFRVLAGLLLVLITWAYTKLRLRYIQRKNNLLQQRITAHTMELQEALTQLKNTEGNLRRQNRIQELLIASITHDIKNPLKYLVVMTKHLKQQLVEKTQTEETLEQSIKVLHDSSYRMYYLTDNLLQYIRLYARTDGQPVTYQSVPLDSIVAEKIGIFRDAALARGTVIVNEVPAGMKVRGHYLVLAIIMHNLLDNAIKYTSEGTITISAQASAGQLRIMISDTGIGMEPATVNWYNEYYNKEIQPDHESGLPGHAGLGLVIVRELIRLIQGRVLIESGNTGTTVSILLDQ